MKQAIFLTKAHPIALKGKAGFYAWLKTRAPAAYEKLLRDGFRAGLAATDSSSDTSGGTDWTNLVTSIVSPLMQGYQQKQMIDIQVQRAKAGLPPLPDDQMAAKVKVMTGIDQYIPWIAGGVIGLGALYLFLNR